MANRGPNRVGRETRDRLLGAGIARFHSTGFNATGIDLITKDAEVPKGSFYNFFSSKEEFALEVIDLYFERHRTRLQEYLGNRDLAPLERLRGYFDERIAFFTNLGFQRGCMMGNLSLETADSREEMRLRLAANFNEWSEAIASTIQEGQKIGEITRSCDANELANFVLNSWEGAILRMKASKTAQPLETAKTMLLELLAGKSV